MKMGGCAALFDSYLLTERTETELTGGPLLKRRLSESDDLVVKKRQSKILRVFFLRRKNNLRIPYSYQHFIIIILYDSLANKIEQ